MFDHCGVAEFISVKKTSNNFLFLFCKSKVSSINMSRPTKKVSSYHSSTKCIVLQKI